MTEIEKNALAAYSRGDITALDLRCRLGGVSYGDVLRLLSDEAIAFHPRAEWPGMIA